MTILVYQGGQEEVRNLASASGLDLKQTILVADPDRKITDELYHSDPCPRVFVLDRKGIVRYVNVGPDDTPREAPAIVIAARALDALRQAARSEDKESATSFAEPVAVLR